MVASALITVMSNAAIKAGKGLLRDFGEVDQLQISRKSASNFVTKSDLRTEKLLQKELNTARPTYGFLLEEGGEIKGKPGEAHRFIIDPLDGTNNFIHAVPYFCISIAVEKTFPNGDSEIVAGLIYDPIHNEIFSAEKGKGGFVNGRKLQVSARENLEEAMIATGNTAVAGSGAATMRHFGASALDLAYLAAGRIDACWYHNIQPWDIAAGMLLVQEAGGIVTTLDGKPASTYNPSLLATNKALRLPVQKLVA